jgi:hypothetical protein
VPNYKKKKVSNKFSRKRNNRINDSRSKKEKIYNDFEINMNPDPSSKRKKQDSIKVVKGKKLERQRKFKIFLATVVILLVTYLILTFTLPVSVGENISNFTATFGSGEYPIEIYGTDVIDSHSKGLYYYVLTDTNISAFSNSGKEIYTYSHGYENPVLKTSETRAMVFSQGGNTLEIYNLSKKIKEYKPKKAIITADICRNGSYAVATYSDSYATAVKVFDKNTKVLFKWNSAKDTVNTLTLSPNGRYLVVSTFNANDGNLNSKISVFDIKKDTATPKASFEFKDNLVYLLSAFGKGFNIVTGDGASFVDWKNFSKTEFNTDRQLDMYRSSSDGSVAVFNLDSNKSDNVITVISPKGEKISTFNFHGIISDIKLLHNHIYCMSEAKIYLYDQQGNLLSSEGCGFDVVKLAVTGSQSVAVISDSKIQKIDFKG